LLKAADLLPEFGVSVHQLNAVSIGVGGIAAGDQEFTD
jgi:hypothetical protein